MKRIIRSVKGTRDFYPEQMAFRQWLYSKIKIVSQNFGYQEFDGPILESLYLYAAKSSEELVKEQAYVFSDRGNEQVALRPELTPTLARMVAQKQQELVKPIRWWSFGPFWRYENTQKGRTREFFQWNIDLIGSTSIYAEAEIVAILAEFFRSLGLTPKQVVIMVNDRKLMRNQIQTLGLETNCIEDVYRLIDKLDKLPPEDWFEYGKEKVGLNEMQLSQLLKILNDRDLWNCSKEMIDFFKIINDLGVNDFIEFDPAIIRGLDYYTGLVFEARDRKTTFRAILGGGRYDNLVANVGGVPLSGVGFGLGDVVIGLILDQYGLKPVLNPAPAKALLTLFSEDLLKVTTQLATQLRLSGVKAEVYPDPVKLDRQLKYASLSNIPLAIIIGPDEAASFRAKVKNLINGEQIMVNQNEVVDYIKNK